MLLSKRLMTVVQSVTPGNAALDVGCDHAYAAVWLVQNGISPCAVASDIRPGPLRAASEHIGEAGLSDRIAVIRADGIPGDYRRYTEDRSVTLILAGMGGRLMTEILERGAARGLLTEEIIASPQRDRAVLRKWLAAHSFQITAEEFLLEDGKYYTVIRAEKREAPVPELTEAEAEYGPLLLREKNGLLAAFLRKRETDTQEIIGKIDDRKEQARIRKEQLRGELLTIREALREMEVAYAGSSER